MIERKFIIPLPPSVNRLWKIVRNKRTGKAGKAQSDAYRGWITKAGWTITLQRIRPVRGPYRLRLGASRSTKMDLGNIEKAISDLLQEMRLIDNDSLAEEIIIRWSDEAPNGEVIVTLAEA